MCSPPVLIGRDNLKRIHQCHFNDDADDMLYGDDDITDRNDNKLYELYTGENDEHYYYYNTRDDEGEGCYDIDDDIMTLENNIAAGEENHEDDDEVDDCVLKTKFAYT